MQRLPRLPERVGTGLGVLGILALLGYPHSVAYAGLAGLVALAALRWRVVGRPLPESPFAAPFGLYLAGAVVGLYATIRPHAAGVRFFGLLAALGAFYLVLDRAASVRAARWTLGGALVLALLGVPCLPLLRGPTAHVPEPLRPWLGTLWEVSGPLWQRAQALDDVGQRYRLTSGGLGMLAAYGACLTLGPMLAGTTRRARLLGAGAAGYFGAFLVLSGSRTAQLSAALVFLTFGTRRRRWFGALALLLVVVAAGLILGLPPLRAVGRSGGPLDLLSRFGGSPESFHQRLEIWQNAFFLLGDFRFTGAGLGLASVEALYHTYFLPTRLDHVHSIFAQSYLEQGLPGLAGLLAIIVIALVVGWRILARASGPAVRSIAISSAAASLVLLLNGLTEIGPLTSVGMVLLFGTLGLLGAAGALERRSPDGRPAAGPPVTGRAAGAVSALVTLVVLLAALAPAVLAAVRGRAGSGPPPRARQAVSAIVAAFSVNLGALHAAHATQAQHPPQRRQRDLEAACAHLEMARSHDPGNPAIYRNLATVALAASRPTSARRLLAKTEALATPDDGRLRFQIARLYQESGDVDRAIFAWARVDPAIGAGNDAGPDVQVIRWGETLVRSGQWSDAVKVNRAAVRLAPTNPAPYRALTVAISEGQGEEAALAMMHGLARAYPDVPWAYEETAALYVRRGLGAEARAWDERAKAVWRSEEWKARRQARSGGGDVEEVRGGMTALPGESRAEGGPGHDLDACGSDAASERA